MTANHATLWNLLTQLLELKRRRRELNAEIREVQEQLDAVVSGEAPDDKQTGLFEGSG
jgi:uncharacterized coiled-coil DUF342 family protein